MWDSNLNVVDLGLPQLPGTVAALCISADGTFIGGGNGQAGGGAGFGFIWTQATGYKSVASVLSEAGLDVTGWSFSSVKGISSEGPTFVGLAVDPAGEFVNFFARIPTPSTVTCAAGLTAI